jgi:hypothetical protein
MKEKISLFILCDFEKFKIKRIRSIKNDENAMEIPKKGLY